MTRIHANEVRPGDVLEYGGQLHAVSHVEWRAGWSWPVAADDTGWAMALGRELVTVHRRAA